MQLSRRAFSVSGLSLVALAVTIAACADRDPVGPLPEPIVPPGVRPIAALECVASVADRQVTCRAPAPDLGDARGDIIVGGQNLYVTMAASNITNAGGVFAFDATLTNLIPQPMGTEDGVNPAAQGIRVFFHTGPTATEGSGNVSVNNPDGFETFTSSNQPFFRYSEILDQNETSAAKNWQIAYDPGVDAFAFTLYVSAPVQYEDGWIAVTPETSTILPGDSVQLSGTVYDFVGRIYGDPITWDSDPDSIATVDSSGRVAGVEAGTATITATATITLPGRGPVVVSGTSTVIVNTPLMARDTTYDAIGNVTLAIDEARGLENVVDDPDGDPVSIVAGTVATAEGGSVTFATNGSFSYLSAPGFAGRDSVQYSATDGVDTASAWLKLVSETRYWYVEAGAESAGANGTDAAPFPGLAGAAGVWAAGDTTLVRSGDASTIQGGVTLLDGQGILGEAIAGDFEVELNGEMVILLAGGGTAPVLGRSSAGATLTLGADNILRGLVVGSSDGAAITGTGFGTLTTSELWIGATGPALSLTNGALAGTIAQLTSTNSTGRGLSLVNVTGSLVPTAGGISGAAGEGVYVEGGTVTVSYPGDITNAAGRSVHVTGRTEGTVTFSGDIADTGTGILVTGNTGGTVRFTGTSKSLSTGANAAVTLSNNTGATIVFQNGGLDIETTTGTGFSATSGGTVAIFDGAANDDIAVSGAAASALVLNGVSVSADGIAFATVGATGTTTGPAINVDGIDGAGTLSIASAEVAGTAAGQSGIRVAGNSAPVTIASATVDGTGGPGILVSFNTGAVTVSGGTIGATTAPTGAGIALAGGTGNVTIASSVTKGSAGRIADVQDRSAGTVELTGTMSCTTACTGILAQNNSGGVIGFNATSKTLTTGANQAVTLANNAGATIGFGGGGLAITTTTGTGFGATGGGAVNVSGGSNHISTNTGSALLLNGVTLGGSGMAFATLNVTGAAVAPVVLTNVGVTTGSQINVAGGTIASGAGPRIAISGGTVNLTWAGTVQQATAAQRLLNVSGGHTSGILHFTGTLSATNGTGLGFDNADGIYIFTGTTTLNGGDAGIDILNGSGGDFSFGPGASISNPSGIGLEISNSAPAFAFTGPITHNAGRAVSLSNVGGTVTLSNNISGSGPSASGILVQNSSANVTFSGGSKSLSTQGNAAVTLTNNSGSILFSGGGLALTTTTGAALTATGTGTLQVTGANNTINTGTGTGFSLNGLGTGAGGITFRDISVNGGTNGISIVNSSGAGFQVAGTGGTCTIATPTCTGGHIQNTSGTGVHLSNAGTVNLTRVRVRASGAQGVHATGSTALTLTSSYLQANGSGDGHNGLNVLNATGSILVNNSTINGAFRHLVQVNNTSSNLTFTVQNSSVFEFPNPVPNPVGAHPFPATSAILINPRGSSVISASVTNSTFRNIPGYSFQFSPDGSATATSTATFSNNNVSVDAGLNVTCASNNQCRVGNLGIGGSGGTTHAIVTNNTFNRVNGDGVFLIGSNSSSVLRGRFEGNSISNAIDDAIVIGRGQNSNSRLQFHNNTITNIGGDAFEVAAGEDNNTNVGRLDLVITDHTISNVATNAALAAWGGIGVFRFGHSAQELCLAATGNSVTGSNFGIDFYGDGNFTGHGGSMVYEMAGTGAVTDSDVATANPGMTAANVITSGMTRSNGALCNRPGI